jgi:secreted PhoX family phosphatase
MKKLLLALMVFGLSYLTAKAQIFDEELVIPGGYAPSQILLPPSPLDVQVLFVGGVDWVETTPTYGNPAGRAYAKEWHDFIGFTPDNTGESLGWVSVNHESIYHDDRIGDGGGMTTFRIKRNQSSGQLEVMEQTLEDGRNGKFFNVDFANTVGETGMNCGGINSVVDGRVWTAEEWFRTSNSSINNGVMRSPNSESWFPKAPGTAANQGVRDTFDFTVSSDLPGWDGRTLKKYENFNYMVEIDPRQAKAIRKQYNWGRQGYEGGAVANDNQTVYLGVDATPGFFSKFVADVPGDFRRGQMYVYKHDDPNYWVEVPDALPENLLNYSNLAVQAGATMFNRNEWVAYDKNTGIVYWTETGRDNPASRWRDEAADGAVHAPHHIERANEQSNLSGTTISPDSSAYWDYYGRVLQYDPVTHEVSVTIEGGPYFDVSPTQADYPSKHLSNPDGLQVIEIDGQSFLLIEEDLNGTSFGRTPDGVSNRLCEVYLLNLSIENPTVDDLVRLTAVPAGAEVTGAVMTPDGESLLLNSQHPASTNPFPFNHSLTFAIHGFSKLTVTGLSNPNFEQVEELQIYPNPTTRQVFISDVVDAALYSADGKRLQVYRQTNELDVSQYPAGMYYLKIDNGEIKKLIIQ